MSLALITGSNGLVGSEMTNFLLDKGFEVIGIDNNERKKLFGKEGDTTLIKKKIIKKFKNYKHFNCDITDYNQLKYLFRKFSNKIEFILHAAAQPSHDWAYQNVKRDFEINSVGTLNMLELTKKYNPRSVFIFTSTNKVYGDNPNNFEFIENKSRWDLKKNHRYYNGIDETLSVDNCTRSFFGVSKSYADFLVQEFNKNCGLKAVNFRAGCITGPNHRGVKMHGFLSFLVKSCIQKKEYELIGYKGKQVRDNIHSNDLINAFWNYYLKPSKESIYNIGGGRFSNCSILEALNFVEKKTSIKVKKKIHKDNRIGDHKWYISDISKFLKDYPNFKINYNIEKIINELIENEI
jgi:CDP-paratose 2-epimerase